MIEQAIASIGLKKILGGLGEKSAERKSRRHKKRLHKRTDVAGIVKTLSEGYALHKRQRRAIRERMEDPEYQELVEFGRSRGWIDQESTPPISAPMEISDPTPSLDTPIEVDYPTLPEDDWASGGYPLDSFAPSRSPEWAPGFSMDTQRRGEPMEYHFGYDQPISGATSPAGSGGGFLSTLGGALGGGLVGLLGNYLGQDPVPGDDGRPKTGPTSPFKRKEEYWRRDAARRYGESRFHQYGLGGGALPAKLEGIQPGDRRPPEYDFKPRIPKWQWPLTYPELAMDLISEAMSLAVMDHVQEDTLKRLLRPIPWKMAHQMAYDIRSGTELAQYLFKGTWGDTPVDRSRGMAILALVLQDMKPRRRRRRVVPKYVERFFDRLGDMKKVVNKFYEPNMGPKMKRPSRRRRK
jgi:hypothetical protein